MNRGYPSLEEAEALIQGVIGFRRNRYPNWNNEEQDMFHYRTVAETAAEIAEHLPYLDTEKAYILGLLHDYGYRLDQSREQRFHGQEGYECMMSLGYPDVAKICLTHTFSKKDFALDEFSYPDEWLIWAKDKLKDIEYDDYDRLIQLCDKLNYGEGLTRVTIEQRAEILRKNYNLNAEQYQRLLSESLELKSYFDLLCQKDIYEIIGLK